MGKISTWATRLIVVTVVMSLLGCATMTGPPVLSEELAAEKARLAEKAQAFKQVQEERVKRIGSQLLTQMDSPLNVDFAVMPGGDVNAIAIFGKVIVTYGMLRFLESDDELAVVLGHELAHLRKGHMQKRLMKGVLLTILSGLGEEASPRIEQALTQEGGPVTRGFDWDQEREADILGLYYAYQAGFDPEAGARIWERFVIEMPVSTINNFFSTHPTSLERVLKTRKTARLLRAGKSLAEIEAMQSVMDSK